MITSAILTQDFLLTPRKISGLQSWFDASQITGLSNNDKVAIWYDKSGNGYNAEQSTSGKRPTYLTNQINSRPCVAFRRVNAEGLIYTSGLGMLNNAQGISWIGVYKQLDTGTATNLYVYLNFTGGAGRFGIFNKFGGNYYTTVGRRDPTTSVATLRSTKTLDYSNYVLHTTVWDTTIKTANQYIDGSAEGGSTDFQTTGNFTAADASAIAIGFHTDQIQNTNNCDIAEIIVYNRALSATERAMIESYLTRKYAL